MSKISSVYSHRFGRDTFTDKNKRMVGGVIVFAPRGAYQQKKMLLPSDTRDHGVTIHGGSVASIPLNQIPKHAKVEKEDKSGTRQSVLSALGDLFKNTRNPKRKRVYDYDSNSDEND